MLEIVQSPEFLRDVKKAAKKRRDIQTLRMIVETLAASKPVPAQHRDHALVGGLRGNRELHISWKPDWLLIYDVSVPGKLYLVRAGSHDELFR